jgi:predicted CXXCH cytochrome family protein
MAALPLTGQPSPPYAGTDACKICHGDIAEAFAKSSHHLVDTDKKLGWDGRACESCHGPGQKHAETTDATAIRNPAKLTAAALDAICLTCHLGQRTLVGRLYNSHAKDAVACTTCHRIHIDKPEEVRPPPQTGQYLGGQQNRPEVLAVRRPAPTNELCTGCHRNIWAQFQRPNHHRLPEGAMTCVDCHNPHGTIWPAMTQSFAANEPGCFKCHGDKRGPFTFEHPPFRFAGCEICHEIHGSANPRMLTRQSVQYVCLECHANLPTLNRTGTIGVVPPSFHDLRSPIFQNCTVCHQKIHGSYVDRNLLR